MAGASSVDETCGDGTLVGPLPPSPADAGVGGVRRSARGGRRAVGVGGNAGRRGSIVGRAIIGKAGNLGTSNNEAIGGTVPDVGPLESVVHSR